MELSLIGQIAVIYVILQFFTVLTLGVGAFFHVEVCKSIFKYCKRNGGDLMSVAIVFGGIGSIGTIVGLLLSIKEVLVIGLVFVFIITFICFVFISINGIFWVIQYLSDLHERLGKRKYK